MKNIIHSFSLAFVLLTVGAVGSAFYFKTEQAIPALRFPYKQAGLTDREAAAHLISRFSFGVKPNEVDAVLKTGIEDWFKQQLAADLPDGALQEQLAGYESLKMTNEEIVKTYPKGGQVLKMAIKDGILDKDSAKLDKKDYKDDVKAFMQEKGIKPQAELLRQLVNQKVLSAAYSNNQLREVLTDFWFNHFNVAASKGGVQQFITSYERDVIRPNVLGKFETLLLATAKSPAMLTFLDNNKSTVNEENMGEDQIKAAKRRNKTVEMMQEKMMEGMDTAAKRNAQGKIKKPKMQGLNENYAREIMELHTLGVDGGYTQSDVTQAARVLTGWSLNPMIEYGIKPKRMPNQKQLDRLGFVYDDNFLFAANKHDGGEKKVLGTTFPAGAGYEEGVKLIHLLATHPSTAKFIAKKIAIRFVSDAPPQSLVDKMAKTFLHNDGDIKEILTTMVNAPEFWAKDALREKTKSPFELAISSIRATGADVVAPFQLYQWVAKMGQRVYNYQAPTGFPDKGQYWINTGSLLNRMNFGLALASGRIPGVKLNLLALNDHHEPESAEDALRIYSKILMPERNVEETVKRLTPMLNDPELQKKIDEAAGQTATSQAAMMEDGRDDAVMNKKERKGANKIGKKNNEAQVVMSKGNNTMLGQVVGIIIGSPEFQRR
ncbi:MAG TPA: DUF1800 domain-containing protein [Flavisolibacter sp.]|nr:DUF1800 domain-containing protein [Flavisolibacter sp.]